MPSPKLWTFCVVLGIFGSTWGVQHHVYKTTATKDEILQRNCAFAKGLHPNLIRFVTKEGFHREIEDVVEVTFTNSPLSPADFKTGECKLALLVKFGRELYVDPYEIHTIPNLADDVLVLNKWTDLEGPSWNPGSNSTVFIHLHSNPTGNLVTTEQLRLPIHFRYQKPLSHSRFKNRLINQGHVPNPGALINPAGYVKVIVPLPRLLLRCDTWNHSLIEDRCHVIKTVCNSKAVKDELCEWISLPFKSNSGQGSPVFMPVGDSDQVLMVTAVTLLVILGGTIFLLHTLVKTKEKLYGESSPTPSNDDNNSGNNASTKKLQ